MQYILYPFCFLISLSVPYVSMLKKIVPLAGIIVFENTLEFTYYMSIFVDRKGGIFCLF